MSHRDCPWCEVAPGDGMTWACERCGSAADPAAAGASERAPPVAVDTGRPLQLRCGTAVYRVRNLDELRRWILERRVAEVDLISTDGIRWEPVAAHPDLGPLLRVVRKMDAPRPRAGQARLQEASSPESGWGVGDVAPDPPAPPDAEGDHA